MSNLTITASSVALTDASTAEVDVAGETFTAGEVLYQYMSDSLWYKAISSDTSAKAKAACIAATGATAAGQKFTKCTRGDIVIGATLTLNTLYVLSATSGKICPLADLVEDNWVVIIGIPKTTALLKLDFSYLGFQTPNLS